MMTSSPCSRNAVKTEYWPRKLSIRIEQETIVEIDTFICPACNKDFRFDIKIPMKLRTVERLEGFPEADPAARVRVMIRCDRFQSVFGGSCDPSGRGKVHVTLAQIDAIGG